MSRSKVILFISYWSANDVLTASTVLPHIEVLKQLSCVSKIILVTIERKHDVPLDFSENNKVIHIYLMSRNFTSNLLSKINDFYIFPKQLQSIVERGSVDSVIALGAPAGALAYKVWQKLKVPFYVSSFEPHADYMLESNVWSKFGLKYTFQKHWEQQQKKFAAGLMPVANSYRRKLIEESVPVEKLFTVPCAVDINYFKYNQVKRNRIREQLGWENSVVGTYVGKYGGLYYNEEAFKIYKQCLQLIPDFRLIILSPQENESIIRRLRQANIDVTKVLVRSVPHEEVPQYLSAADFAFATIKSYPSAIYCSPVKIGEYWANGLPVLLTEDVGDDSDIIKKEGGGALFNLKENGSVERAIRKILQILEDPSHRQQIPELAKKYRSPDKIREAYEYFFGKQEEKP